MTETTVAVDGKEMVLVDNAWVDKAELLFDDFSNIALDKLEEDYRFDEKITDELYNNEVIGRLFGSFGVDNHIGYVHSRMAKDIGAEECKRDVYEMVEKTLEMQEAGFTDDFLVKAMEDGMFDHVYESIERAQNKDGSYEIVSDAKDFMKVYTEQDIAMTVPNTSITETELMALGKNKYDVNKSLEKGEGIRVVTDKRFGKYTEVPSNTVCSAQLKELGFSDKEIKKARKNGLNLVTNTELSNYQNEMIDNQELLDQTGDAMIRIPEYMQVMVRSKIGEGEFKNDVYMTTVELIPTGKYHTVSTRVNMYDPNETILPILPVEDRVNGALECDIVGFEDGNILMEIADSEETEKRSVSNVIYTHFKDNAKTYLKAGGIAVAGGLVGFALPGCGTTNYNMADIPMSPMISHISGGPGIMPVGILASPATGSGNSSNTNLGYIDPNHPSTKDILKYLGENYPAPGLDNGSNLESTDAWREGWGASSTLFYSDRSEGKTINHHLIGFDASIFKEYNKGGIHGVNFGGAWDTDSGRDKIPVGSSGDLMSSGSSIGSSNTGGQQNIDRTYNEFWAKYSAVDMWEALPYLMVGGHWTSKGKKTSTNTTTNVDFDDPSRTDRTIYSTTNGSGRTTTNKVGAGFEINPISGWVKAGETKLDISAVFDYSHNFNSQTNNLSNPKGSYSHERDTEQVEAYTGGISVTPTKDANWKATAVHTATNGRDGEDLNATSIGGFAQFDNPFGWLGENSSISIIPILTVEEYDDSPDVTRISGMIVYSNPAIFGKSAPNQSIRNYHQAFENALSEIKGSETLKHIINAGITLSGSGAIHGDKGYIEGSVGWNLENGWTLGGGVRYGEGRNGYHSLTPFFGGTYEF